MPIEYVQGDLLKSDCDVIGHGCNCFNSFGAGIALQMMNEHMPAWHADQATQRGDINKLGTFTMATDESMTAGLRIIFNLYTQYSFSRYKISVDYDAVTRALIAMKQCVDEIRPNCKLGLPKLGAGLAMGNWDTIATIIERVFIDRIIYIYYL